LYPYIALDPEKQDLSSKGHLTQKFFLLFCTQGRINMMQFRNTAVPEYRIVRHPFNPVPD
jgi:hypothetical protein